MKHVYCDCCGSEIFDGAYVNVKVESDATDVTNERYDEAYQLCRWDFRNLHEFFKHKNPGKRMTAQLPIGELGQKRIMQILELVEKGQMSRDMAFDLILRLVREQR